MSKQYISREIRRRVAEASRFRCSYCLTAQEVIGPLLEVDHIFPESKGGTADDANLALACPLCNRAKSNKTEAIDPETGSTVRLFHPYLDIWRDHFRWSADGINLLGTTPTGRATVAALDVNQPDMQLTRSLWVDVGWHPPADSV